MARDVTSAGSAEVSTLGPGISVKGSIQGDGDLRIEGMVEGDIALAGALHVAPGAEVRADVEAASAVVEGVLEGDVTCEGPVQALAESTLKGTVRAESFTMEEGARVSVTVEAEFDMPEPLSRTGR